MRPQRHNSMLVHLALAAIVPLLALSGCLGGDPFPDPDPAEDRDTSADETGGEADGDTGKDDYGDPDANDGAEDVAGLVFASAPNDGGLVTVAGTPNALTRTESVRIENAAGDIVSVAVRDDGSFAARIAAESAATLSVTPEDEGGEPFADRTLSIIAGARVASAVGNGIIGSGSVSVPDTEGQAAVSGNGTLLGSGYLVVVGNVTLSTAVTTYVSCSPECRFDAFVQAESGDELDLFLVPVGANAGVSESQTVSVP